MTDVSVPMPLDPGEAQLSLCLDCAKHPSLKALVEAHAATGVTCGVCHAPPNVASAACEIAQIDALTNLTKALVRFYFSEYLYNGHWGGDVEPEDLLAEPNPITETETHLFKTRDPEAIMEFFGGLFAAQPYPPRDKGVWLYAGHGPDGARDLQFAISERDSPILSSFRRRLNDTNPFHLEPEMDSLLMRIGPRIDRAVDVGAKFFRARKGVKQVYHNISDALFATDVRREPYQAGTLGAPSPLMTGPGRLNRAGFAYLYLASDAATAAAEIRPHPGHFLSIGQFESTRRLRIASFDQDIADFAQSDEDLELFHFLYSADLAMATPVTPEAATRYSITQLIADCLRRAGFDGVSFKSSLSAGVNLCVFDPGQFAYVHDSAVVMKVRGLAYDLEDSATILSPTADDLTVPD